MNRVAIRLDVFIIWQTSEALEEIVGRAIGLCREAQPSAVETSGDISRAELDGCVELNPGAGVFAKLGENVSAGCRHVGTSDRGFLCACEYFEGLIFEMKLGAGVCLKDIEPRICAGRPAFEISRKLLRA